MGAQVPEESAGPKSTSEPFSRRALMRRWRSRLATAAAGLTLATWGWWATSGGLKENLSVVAKGAGEARQKDAAAEMRCLYQWARLACWTSALGS